MSQVVGSKKIGFRRVIQKVVAGVDAGMKVRVDEAGRHKTPSGVDLFVDWLAVLLANKLDPITIKNDDTVSDDLVFLAVKTNLISALDDSFHAYNLLCFFHAACVLPGFV